MNKFYGKIYIHKNKVNNKCYVGQTTWRPVSKRWGKDGIHYRPETLFGKAIKKYGWNNFEHIILPQVYHSQDELNQAEKDMIAELDSFNNGYNMTTGGDTYVKSQETKRKISNSKLGHAVSQETREKLRQANIGKKASEETKRKMAIKSSGRKQTDEAKLKLRNQRPKVRIDKFDLDGNYIMTYECLQDIARECNKDIRSSIKRVCRGEIKSLYGFIWKYSK